MDSHSNECFDENTLRYYLDEGQTLPVPGAEQIGLTAHLESCRSCQERLITLKQQISQVSTLLEEAIPSRLSTEPDPQKALARIRMRYPELASKVPLSSPVETTASASKAVRANSSKRFQKKRWSSLALPAFSSKLIRPWPRMMGLATLLLIVGWLALPSISAAAEQLLQVFRVQNTVFIPVDPQRVQEIMKAGLQNGKTLFLGVPNISNSGATTKVNSVTEAANTVGFVAKIPQNLPGSVKESEILVRDGLKAQFQLNAQTLRQVLALLKITDVTVPDELGNSPIKAEMPPFIEQHFQGQNYELSLYQSLSPQLNLPDKVDMTQLSQIVLRVFGLNAQQAQSLSKQVDLRSALLFPFPTQLNSFKQLQIGSSQGLLVNGDSQGKQTWLLYWQQGEQFFVLYGQGKLREADLLAVANSLK